AAVDTCLRFDVEKLFGRELRLLLRGVNAIDGANADARGVLRSNARFRNCISHAEAPWARVEKPVSFLILPRRSRRVQPPSRRADAPELEPAKTPNRPDQWPWELSVPASSRRVKKYSLTGRSSSIDALSGSRAPKRSIGASPPTTARKYSSRMLAPPQSTRSDQGPRRSIVSTRPS